MKPKVLAVVPARAGSKRLASKNIKLLNGLPLVAHTFEAIKSSQYISATIATSDCAKVLEISTKYPNTYSLKRSIELASDTASTLDVLLDAVEYAKQFGEFDIVCLLQPTSPLRTTQDIDNAIALYIEKNAKGIISLTKCQHSPLWTTSLDTDAEFKTFISGITNTRSQDLKEFYQLNGAIYLVEQATLLNTKKLFFVEDYYPFIMSEQSSIDIDTHFDFKFAELILQEIGS